MLRDLECNMIRVPDDVSSLEICAACACHFVDRRSLKREPSGTGIQNQIALRIKLDPIRALDLEFNVVRIRSGGNLKIVFKLAMITVIDEVNSTIDVFITDFAIGRDVCFPLRTLVPDKVVHNSWLLIFAHYCRVLSRSRQPELHQAPGTLLCAAG